MSILPDNHPERTELLVMFRILRRSEWEALQSWRRSCPGSTVEHLYRGLYILAVPAGGASEAAA